MDKIFKDLYIGNMFEATRYKHIFDVIICVQELNEMDLREQEDYFAQDHEQPIYIMAPIIRNFYKTDEVDPLTLDFIVDMIWKCAVKDEQKVLVHCGAGQERAPTTVIAFLMRYGHPDTLEKMTLDEAYEFVKRAHPRTQDRRSWLRFYENSVPAR